MRIDEILEAINDATDWIMEVSGDDNHEIALELSRAFDELNDSKYAENE